MPKGTSLAKAMSSSEKIKPVALAVIKAGREAGGRAGWRAGGRAVGQADRQAGSPPFTNSCHP